MGWELHVVSSSAIKALAYDGERRMLCVKFVTGRAWSYSNVERLKFDELLCAPSKGWYFTTKIRKHHWSQELSIDEILAVFGGARDSQQASVSLLSLLELANGPRWLL